MDDPRESLTGSASLYPGGVLRHHSAEGPTWRPVVQVEGCRTLKGAVRLCCVLVLLAVVGLCSTCSYEVRQVAALRLGARSRESRSVARRETSERDEHSEGEEFDFERYEFFLKVVDSLSPEEVLSEATELMRLMSQRPTNIRLIDMVGKILFDTFVLDNEFIIAHQESIAQLVQIARKNLLAIPIPSGDMAFWGKDIQIAVVRTEDKSRDPVVALCSLRDLDSKFEKIPRSILQATKMPFDKCYLALAMSNTKLQNTTMAIVAYPANWIIRPLPSIGNETLNSRVVDVAIEPSTRRESSGDTLLSIFFKASLTANTTKGCAFWSKMEGNWNTDGCWVDLDIESQTDVCYCNMTAQLEEDATGGQYIVYEFSDVFFNPSSYAHIINIENSLQSPDYYFSQASALAHNLSLVPVNLITIERLQQIVLSVLSANYLPGESKPNFTMNHIRRLYLDVRKFLRNQVFINYNPLFVMRSRMAIILYMIDNPNIFKYTFHFTDYPQNLAFIPSNSNEDPGDGEIDEKDFNYFFKASRSVAKQNKQVAYMLFPVNHFLFFPITKFGHFQVHNFRVVDVTLVPRVGVESEEDQFIDIWYRPSIFTALAKDVRLGCMYWSYHNSVWTDKSCAVHVNAMPRGCRCNLSANFDDNREGGQYAVFEYSDVRLDYEGINRILGIKEADFNQQNFALWEISTILHNMTRIGYINENFIRDTCHLALLALTVAEDVLRLDGDLSYALIEDIHFIVQSWASDSVHTSAGYGTYDLKSISTSSPTAAEAHEVLSNKVVRTKNSVLQQMTVVVLRLGLQDSDIGEKLTPRKATFLNKFDIKMTVEPQFSFYFSLASEDKVSFAAIMYPESKIFLPLSRSLPALFSFHCLELTVVSEDNAGVLQTSSRLVTLVYIPEGPERAAASTACAVWTGNDWSAKTCWPDVGSEHACTCNLTAHELSVGKFLSLLVFEALEVKNFSPKGSLNTLDVLYVISSTISLVSLLLIALTASVFQLWRADVGHKILLHMSVALFLYQALRVFRETHHVYTALNRDDAAAFVAFAAVTHYSRLAHYAWMLTMSVLQLRRLLTVVGAVDVPHLLRKVSALAWGLPLVPLAALLSWDRVEHFAKPNKLTHLVLYLVPGAVVTAVNLVLFLIIAARVFACFGWGKTDDLGRHGISGAKLTRRRMATVGLLFFLFGTPTVFETVNDFWGHSVTLEVLFKVFDPVRGAVVFFYFIVLDKKTFYMWQQKLRSLTARGATQELEMRVNTVRRPVTK